MKYWVGALSTVESEVRAIRCSSAQSTNLLSESLYYLSTFGVTAITSSNSRRDKAISIAVLKA